MVVPSLLREKSNDFNGRMAKVSTTCAQREVLISRNLEGEAEGRIILARMVVVIGELRNAEIIRARLGALVDAGIKIDEVPAGFAARIHDHFDVALAVEAAGIADIGIVVDDMQDVGRLGPARALEMNAELGADRPAPDIERQRRRLDPERSALPGVTAHIDEEAVRAAEIVRHV